MSTLTKTTKAKPPRRFKKRYVVLPLLLLILVFLGVSGYLAFSSTKKYLTDGANDFENAAQMLKDTQNLTSQAGLNQVKTELQAAQANFKQARSALGFYSLILPVAGVVPGIGYDASHLNDFLDMSDQVSQAALISLDGLQPVITVFQQKSDGTGIGGDRLIRLSSILEQTSTLQAFTQADALLNQVQLERAKIDPTKLSLSQTKKAVSLLDKDLPPLKSALDAAVTLPPLLPNLLGQTTPHNYLVLAENDDELRPTGGFVSAAGIMTVSGGRVTMSGFRDAYSIDNPNLPHQSPPTPLSKYMFASWFLFRDANWWPDFPTSAKELMQLYATSLNMQVDGVIAMNLSAVKNMFDAFGSVTLPELGETINQSNFLDRLYYYYQPPGTSTDDQWWLHRKDFIGSIFKAMVSSLNGSDAHEYFKLAGDVADQLTQRSIQVYFSDPKLESALLSQHNLDGALQSSPGDYLMIADANVGFNKISPKIDEKISYAVTDSGNGQLQAELTITYHNNGGVREGTQPGVCDKVAKYDSSYISMMNGCYWDYVRVYAPQGSTLINVTGFPAGSALDTTTENGKTVWGNQLVILPGADATLRFSYKLPASVWPNNGPYQLIVQKEAGSRDIPLSVQLIGSGRHFGKVTGVQPQQQTAGVLQWNSDLKTDFNVAVAGS